MRKVRELQDFTITAPQKYIAFAEGIIMVGRKVNELIKAHNELVEELQAKAVKSAEEPQR